MQLKTSETINIPVRYNQHIRIYEAGGKIIGCKYCILLVFFTQEIVDKTKISTSSEIDSHSLQVANNDVKRIINETDGEHYVKYGG